MESPITTLKAVQVLKERSWTGGNYQDPVTKCDQILEVQGEKKKKKTLEGKLMKFK